MKVLLVVNPSASAVTARTRVMIQNALSADHDLVVQETSRRGHATRLAQSAAASSTDLVIALGGDGTVNEVTNGLARTHTALGVLPGGSTNVFARTLGFSNEPVEATDQLLGAVGRSSVQRVGLGNVNGRFFCFHVGVGFDAAVVEQVEKRGQLKRWLGHPLFMVSALDTWARQFDRSSPPFRVQAGADAAVEPVGGGAGADDAPVVGSSSVRKAGPGNDGYFAVVLNTDPYTYLGSRPLSLAPHSNLQNGLSVVNLTELGLVSTLRTVSAALRKKRLGDLAHVDSHDDCHTIRIVGHRSFPWQVDGDHLGDTEELIFRWEPKVLDLVLP